MSVEDRERWDERYQQRAIDDYPPPRPLLVRYAPRPTGVQRALDMACGLAQNALYLAELGYEVDALDISRVALRKGQAEMAMRNLRNVNFILADLDHYMLPTACYDLVCVFYFRATGLFPALRTAIRPGGMIIYETFNVRWLETHPEADPDHLLAPGELLRRFAGWQVILATEEGDCSRFVCCKPPA